MNNKPDTLTEDARTRLARDRQADELYADLRASLDRIEALLVKLVEEEK